MKKYIIAVLILLGAGSYYYATQNKDANTNKEVKQEVAKESQDSLDMKAKEEAEKVNRNEAEEKENNEIIVVNGEKLVINFALDSYYLSPKDKKELWDFLEGKEINALTIVGHTDKQGTEEYNQGLSERRAQVVYDYLKDELKLNVKMEKSGEGELNPISDLAKKNRRTEITIF